MFLESGANCYTFIDPATLPSVQDVQIVLYVFKMLCDT